ncbi:uncharacterized protein C7orf57 homolog isoform X2 [Aplysia californica]|uniref:Uncharacterized protein C7orf57 homolog isoform X2 n=1 Tax=Aplysia californica TaxID=6500 RepID=A0ABM0JZ41_APLCA|nr:uncharacterized protein C7orf57 homolog isoform X2 [Aplysia californica]
MPISQNPKECGWFYHAPAKKQVGTERMDAPAPSQIPGIGYDDPAVMEPEQVREMMFKETDSKYIRMAKMGGRKDLLQFHPENYGGKKSEAPVGYHRNEWFYLEDNRMEDEEKKTEEKKEWEFLLPEYMVHKGYKPSFENPATPPSRGRAPFYTEKITEVEREQREGRSATDKTVRIPEIRRPGYGVRNEKPPVAMQTPPPREKPIRPQASVLDTTSQRRGKKNVLMSSETDDPTNMMKLLSGEYEREWHNKLDSMKLEEKSGKAPKPGYDDARYGSAGQNQRMNHKTLTPQKAKGKEEEEKEMFKLSRFQNIPSKIDSHQRPEIMAAVK